MGDLGICEAAWPLAYFALTPVGYEAEAVCHWRFSTSGRGRPSTAQNLLQNFNGAPALNYVLTVQHALDVNSTTADEMSQNRSGVVHVFSPWLPISHS